MSADPTDQYNPYSVALIAPLKGAPRPQSRLLKIGDAAAFLGVSQVTIRRRVRDRSLPHVRIKNRLYFKSNELHAYVEAHRDDIGI